MLACAINNEILELAVAERCEHILYHNCKFSFPSENSDMFLEMKRFYLDNGNFEVVQSLQECGKDKTTYDQKFRLLADPERGYSVSWGSIVRGAQ